MKQHVEAAVPFCKSVLRLQRLNHIKPNVPKYHGDLTHLERKLLVEAFRCREMLLQPFALRNFLQLFATFGYMRSGCKVKGLR